MPSAIIISAVDNNYFPLFWDLMHSLLLWQDKFGFDLGLLDLGLNEENRKKLTPFPIKILKAGIDIEYKAREKGEEERPYFRAMTSRPYLPQNFPGYDVYMWMDSDLWLQTPEALSVLLSGAYENPDALYIASEMDVDYKTIQAGNAQWNSWNNSYYECLPKPLANNLLHRPMLNSGVFAMSAKAPHWKLWGDLLTKRLQSLEKLEAKHFVIEQVCLNLVIYKENIQTFFMPADYNWMVVYGLPLWDEDQKLFTRPSLPQRPLSILHLAAQIKNVPQEIKTTKANIIETPVTFGGFVNLRQ